MEKVKRLNRKEEVPACKKLCVCVWKKGTYFFDGLATHGGGTSDMEKVRRLDRKEEVPACKKLCACVW